MSHNLMQFPEMSEFRTWLEKHRNDCIGKSYTMEACPLATFLSELSGEPYRVNNSVYSIQAGSSAALPPWAQAFVEALDDDYAYEEHPVFGWEALHVFDLIL